MDVEEINVLIHPLYEYYVRLQSTLRPNLEKDLFTNKAHRKRFFQGVQALKMHWGKQIQKVKGREKSVLVILLPTSIDGLSKLPELLKLVGFAEKELQERIVVIPMNQIGVVGQVNSIVEELKRKGLNASSETRFNLFGEYKEDCVYDVENHLRFKLKIDRRRINIDEGLTLTKGTSYGIALKQKKERRIRKRNKSQSRINQRRRGLK